VDFGIFVVWVHVTAVAVWVGGLFAVSWLCIPLPTRAASAAEGARAAEWMARRFLRVSREVVLIIVLSGILNVVNVGLSRGFRLSAAFVAALIAKAALLAVMASIQVWQTLRFASERVALATSGEDESPRAARLQRRAVASAVLGSILSALAILLGLHLRYL
jgi:uncharacterized membrane protein